ncbi:thioredoxin [Bengtsoniella intestinalis]|uniref:thioredoxin n=1 Tax=Bengtsoniella intestinalis TaxID=3073143 RepID=UPI00391FBCA4
MAILHLDNSNFQATVEVNALTVVDFWAVWCGPCKMVAPAFEAAAVTFDGKAVFAKVNVDDAGAVAQQFGIMSIPTMVVLKDGKEIDRSVGVLSQAALEALVQKHL